MAQLIVKQKDNVTDTLEFPDTASGSRALMKVVEFARTESEKAKSEEKESEHGQEDKDKKPNPMEDVIKKLFEPGGSEKVETRGGPMAF
jgi:hypothetical protein